MTNTSNQSTPIPPHEHERLLRMALIAAGAPCAYAFTLQEDGPEFLAGLGIGQLEFDAHIEQLTDIEWTSDGVGSKPVKISLDSTKATSMLFVTYQSAPDTANGGAMVILNPSKDEEARQLLKLIAEEILQHQLSTSDQQKAIYSESQFEAFFEQSTSMMCTHDLQGTLLLINQASASSLGYRKEQLTGKSLFDLVPKNYHRGLTHYLAAIKEKGKSKGTMKVRHRNGSHRIWLYTNVLQQKDSGEQFVLGNALDITERHKLKHEYNRLKEMLEQTNKVARVGGWEVDLTTDTMFWSEVTKEIHEVPVDFVPSTSKGIHFYKEGKNRKAIEEAFARCIQHGEPYDLELLLVTAKGNEIWVRAIGKPEFKNNKCIRVYGTFQDINSQKNAQIELIQSKKLLEDVQNASSEVSIISTDKAGLITVFNKGAEKMLGYSAEEMIGKQSPAIIHDPAEVEERSRELSEKFGQEISGFRVFVHNSEIKGAEEREWTYIRKDGSELFVSLAVTTMRNEDGEIFGYLGMATDITERKKAEEALITEQARLNAFITHAPAAVAMFDRDIRYIAYSNRWREEYQLQGHELKGKSHYEVFGNISEEWKDIHSRCLQGEVISNEEDRWRPEGWQHDQYLRWEVRPWHQHDGSIGGIMMLTQDITEACLQREELKRAKVMAEQASVAKSEFLANMSHEIRTPLNGVIGFTDLVLKTELTDTQSQYLSIVNQSGNALLNIINDILDFSKIEAGKLDLDIDKCDLYELTDQASDIITYEVHKKGLEMLLNIHPDIPRFIWVDSVRLKQVMVNLLGNASKFTEEGEIELLLTPLTKMDAEQEMMIRFSVRDTGIGIKKEKQEKIFEAFSQEDLGTTKKYGGTGLGLTISNSLLKLMDSKLQLISTPGEGSKFYFDLKVKCEYGDPVLLDEDLKMDRILIVDDNDNNRMILERMLSLRGIESDQAKSGFEAIQKLVDGEKYDVVLMDYHMPYMNGIETIRKIREIVEKQPIIFLHSSSDDDSILKACRELDVRLKLVKPIKLQEMYNALLTLNRKQEHKIAPPKKQVSTAQSVLPQGTKVLIVEDNTINMLLAKTVISNLSPDTTILEATNGLEALEMVKKELPSIILMDIQMPEMNGYEATREIRKRFNKHPFLIIALTAGNIKGEKEKCLSAGMNDFISKPFVEEDLLNLLKKWDLGAASTSIGSQALSVKSGESAFDLDKLRVILGSPDWDSEMFQIILKSGLKELKNSRTALKELLETHSNSLSIVAHKLYGTACTMHMEPLSKLSARLETKRNYDFKDPGLIREINATLEELDVVIDALKKYIVD